MRELLATLDDWARSDPEMALATVIRTSGSTPRPAGARLLVSREGRMAGSVSGGCLESAVILEGQATLRGAAPPRVLHYGISDELGWSVGLSCGGSCDIFIETLRWDGSDEVLIAARQAIDADRGVALMTTVSGPHMGARAAAVEGGRWVGDLGQPGVEAAIRAGVEGRLGSGLAGIEEAEDTGVFVDPVVPAPHLVVVGAAHVAVPLTRMAKAAGYRVTVVDPRRAFLTEQRLPDADRLEAAWPDQVLAGIDLGPRDAAVCLAHDPKFEDPALGILLRGRAGYVGAIGSRGTNAKRWARLREAGLDEAALARLHSPIGLDLGAVTPEEIAVAILAEVVAARRGRRGGALSAKPVPEGLEAAVAGPAADPAGGSARIA
ncbi:MAG TPA: XdhC family protein [Candidatus Binatia bacterium]|nr:XdhC family protein [Candidatus Binatia bacterium]